MADAIQRITPAFFLGTNIPNPKVLGSKVDEVIKVVNAIVDGTESITEVEVGNGTVALPSMTFASDPNTGIYRVGADNIGISAGGTLALDASTTAVTSALPVIVSDSTASTSTVTGSVKTAGGVGIAGALFVSTTTPASISATGVLSVTNATDSTTSTTGSTLITGGLGVAKAIFGGSTVNAATALTVGTTATITGKLTSAAQVLKPTTATVAANSGTTLTAAMMLTGYVEVTGTTGSLALDTVANITTALGHTPVPGESFEFVINTKGATPMTSTNVVTLTAPASCIFMKQFNTTDVGTAFIPTVTATDGIHVGKFLVIFQTATSIVVQRIA